LRVHRDLGSRKLFLRILAWLRSWQGVGGQGGGGNNLLSLLAAGGKVKKRGLNKTNSPCFACQGFGHWADDPECPLQQKRNKPEKKDAAGIDG
jgi:hypothetical protein